MYLTLFRATDRNDVFRSVEKRVMFPVQPEKWKALSARGVAEADLWE